MGGHDHGSSLSHTQHLQKLPAPRGTGRTDTVLQVTGHSAETLTLPTSTTGRTGRPGREGAEAGVAALTTCWGRCAPLLPSLGTPGLGGAHFASEAAGVMVS